MAIEIRTGEDGVARMVSPGRADVSASTEDYIPHKDYLDELINEKGPGGRELKGSPATDTGAQKARR